MSTAPLSPGQPDDFSAFEDIDLPDVPNSLGTAKVENFSDIDLPEVPDSGIRLRLDPSYFPSNGIITLQAPNTEPFSLALNLPGNKESEAVSYTITLPTGRRVLLPLYEYKDYAFSFAEIPVEGTVSRTGEIFLENESRSEFTVNKHPEIQKPTKILAPEKPGIDASFEGEIDGSPFYAITRRACGYSKYQAANEDSLAINVEEGLIAIGDGVGGCELSSIVSHFAVTTFVQRAGTLVEKINRTRLGLQSFQKYQDYTQQNEKLPDSEQKYPGDTTLVGVEIKGSTLNTVTLGDSKWFLVRDNKVFAHNREHNYAAELYYEGQITEEERFIHPQNNVVTTTLGGNSTPDLSYMVEVQNEQGKSQWKQQIEPLTLKKGDRLYLCTDGADCLTEQDFIKVSHLPPKEAALELQKRVAECNNQWEYSRTVKGKDENGKEREMEIILPSPCDNLTLFVYAHQDGYLENSPQFSSAKVRNWLKQVQIYN